MDRTTIAPRPRSGRELARLPAWQLPMGSDPHELFHALARRARVPAILRVHHDDRIPGAGARWLSDGSAEVGLAGGTMEALTQAHSPSSSLAAVLAHEIGHLARPAARSLRREVALALLSVVLLVLCSAVAGVAAGEWRPLLASAPAECFLILIAVLVGAWRERRDELAADAYAVALIGSSDPLKEALSIIACEPTSSTERGLWRLLSSHPDLGTRLHRLEAPGRPKVGGY